MTDIDRSTEEPLELTENELVQRIIFLETSRVGCGVICACRAALALSLSVEQRALLEKHASAVVFDKIPSDASVVQNMFGDTLNEKQRNHLARLVRDGAGKTAQEIRGGQAGALFAIDELRAALSPQQTIVMQVGNVNVILR